MNKTVYIYHLYDADFMLSWLKPTVLRNRKTELESEN